jgi:adhesin transport system outer membrane protein
MPSVLKNKHLFLLSILASAALPSYGFAETLEQAVANAILNHPRVEVARAGVTTAEEERTEKYSKFYPDVTIAGTGGRIFGDNSTSRGSVTTRGSAYSYLWEGSITARQMVYDGFETSSRVDAAEAKQKSAQLNILDVQENLALATAQTYVDLVRTRNALKLLAAHQAKIEDYLSRIKTMVDEGAADEAEYQKARDIKVVLEGFVTDYRGQLRYAEAAYVELTGKQPEGDFVMPTVRQDFILENVDEAVAYAKDAQPLLKSARLMSESASYEVDAEKAVMMPDVNSELSYLKSDKVEELGGELEDAKALLRLNWRYEVGGAQEARIAQKKSKHHESLARQSETERQVELAVRQAYAEYDTALSQLDHQEQRRSLNQTLFETYGTQFEGARITLLQLMEADNQYFTTMLDKSNGQARFLSAQYAILASLGRLRESLNMQVSMNRSEAPVVSDE